MRSIVDYVEVYLNAGLKIIPIKYQSKVPLTVGWNLNWSKDQSLQTFKQYPGSNVGILLGDIIDVEGDTVEANNILEQLIGDYPHPSYKSSKSIHHLFKKPDDSLTRIARNGIEFRGKNHHSVLPPSTHENGFRYKWINHNNLNFPELPTKLRSLYDDWKNEKKSKPEKQTTFGPNHKSSEDAAIQFAAKWLRWKHDVKPNHIKLWCPECNEVQYLHKKRFKKEKAAFESLGFKWACRECREVDVRSMCRN